MRNSPLAADPPPSVSTVFHLAANVNTDASAQEACVNDLGTQYAKDVPDGKPSQRHRLRVDAGGHNTWKAIFSPPA